MSPAILERNDLSENATWAEGQGEIEMFAEASLGSSLSQGLSNLCGGLSEF